MGKKDKRNRDYSQDSEFGEMTDEFSSSMDDEFERNLKAMRGEPDVPLVDDSDDDEEDEDSGSGFSLLETLAGGFGFLLEKGKAGAVMLGVGGLFLARSLMWPVRKAMASFRSADVDDEDGEEEVSPKATEAAVKTGPNKVDAAEMLAGYDDDEDEESPSSWQNWILRGGVAAAVLVLTTAGYFGYKTWTARTEASPTEIAAEDAAEIFIDGDTLPAAGPGAIIDTPAVKTGAAPVPGPKTPGADKPENKKPEGEKSGAKKAEPETKVAGTASPVKPADASKKEEPVKPKNDGKDDPKNAEKSGREKSTKVATAAKPEVKSPAPKVDAKPVDTVATAAKPEVKSPPPKVDAKPANAVAAAAKPDVKPPAPKVDAKPADTVAAAPKPDVKPPAPKVDAKPVDAFAVTAPSLDAKPSPEPKVNDPWAVSAAAMTVPAAVAAADPWGAPSQDATKAASSPAPKDDPWGVNSAGSVPSGGAKPPESPKTEPTPSSLPAFAVSSPATAAPISEPLAPSLPVPSAPKKEAPVSLAAAAPTPKPTAPPELSPMASSEAASTSQAELPPLRPIGKRNETPDMINEQAPAIPVGLASASPKTASAFQPETVPDSARKSGPGISEQAKTSNVAFGRVPTPPTLEKASPLDSSMLPPVRETPKPETNPSIAHAGNITTITPTAAASAPVKRGIGETAPSVPGDPEFPAPGTMATFSTPARSRASETPQAVRAETTQARGESKPPFAPPNFAGAPAVASTPEPRRAEASAFAAISPSVPAAAMATAPTAAPVVAPTPKNNEPSPVIPGDPPASTMAVATPVAPLLPQHAELAKSEIPLGSWLQNEVQELREQPSTPRIRFDTADPTTASTGAVRFNPSTASNAGAPSLLTMPKDPNVATDLSVLLPTGASPPEGVDVSSLPSLDEAPRAVIATTVNPGYGRSMRSGNPAAASIDTVNSAVRREERAMSFQQRINEEIKRSPTETERYTIQEGDTYMTICDRAYGTSLLFRALAEHNRQRLGIDYRPQPGTVIEIPPADYLQTNSSGSFRKNRSRPTNRPTTSTFDSSSVRQNRQGIPYVVQEGETVFNIATDKLKDTPLWREIYAMNTDKIADPRDPIPVGTEILLPVRTAQSGTVRR